MFNQIKAHIKLNPEILNKVITEEYNWEYNFKNANKLYNDLPVGGENLNTYNSFSSIVDSYIDWRQKKPKNDIKDFIIDVLGAKSEYAINLYNNLCVELENGINELKSNGFLVDSNMMIKSMAKFFESKQKVYNLKTLNTMQLYKLKEKMCFCGTHSAKVENKLKDGTVNIALANFIELFGVHYPYGNPEDRICENEPVSPKIINEIYDSPFGKVYIPFPRITEGQKEEFKKLYEYIKHIETNFFKEENDEYVERLDDDERRKYDTLKGKYQEMQENLNRLQQPNATKSEKKMSKEIINNFNALKMQISLGAGIEFFRDEFFTERKVEKHDKQQQDNDGKNTKNEKTDEIRRLEQKNAELEVAKKANEDRIRELERIKTELEASNTSMEKTIKIQEQTIESFKEKTNFLFKFVARVKKSPIGKIFFGKDIKRLPSGDEPKESDDDKEIR